MNFGQFWRLLATLHRQRVVLVMLALLLALAIANEVAIYNIGLITGDYYRILNDKDEGAFLHQTLKSLLLIVAISLLKSFKEFVGSMIYVQWRAAVTTDLQRHYFRDMAFYRLNVLNVNSEQQSTISGPATGGTDNVDQRITQDVDKMANSLSVIIPELMVSPFIIVFYSYRCYSVSGLVGPLGCVTFFLLSTLINRYLIAQVSRYVYAQERCEGNFRFQHLRVRNHAESIAFLSGESMEQVKCEHFLDGLISTQRSLILRQLGLKVSIYLCDYLGSILSFIALSIPLFAGLYNNLAPGELSKLISENSFFTIYLINCFTRLIDLAAVFSTFLGTAGRIAELYQWFKENSGSSNTSPQQLATESTSTVSVGSADLGVQNYQNSSSEAVEQSANTAEEDVFFDCAHLSVDTPECFAKQRNIITDMSFQIRPKQNIIITGPSGTGKSSLMRVLKNIWPLSGGLVKRHLQLENPNSVLFIPQKAVLTTGSLAEQIVYPKVYRKEDYFMDKHFVDRVVDILRFLDLEQAVLERLHYDLFLDLNLNWADHLSAGEVQRLALARVLYHRPRLVFLDEATTALPAEMEQKILAQLAAHSITMVSCGHRDSLRRFHQLELRLSGPHLWQLLSTT